MANRNAPREREPRQPLPPNFAALTTLLPRVTVGVLGSVVAFAAIRHAAGGKGWDDALFVAAIACAGFLCVQFVARPPARVASVVTSLAAVGGLLLGIARIEHPNLTSHLWEGFGVSVAVGAACLSGFLWRALDRVEVSAALRRALTAAIAVVVVCDLASLVRTLSYFADPENNVFLLNEMLAPAAGRVPDATFVPQYVSLYGWLLLPFRHLLSPWHLAQLAVLFLSLLAVSSVVLAVAVAFRSMSNPSLWLAAGIVVPLTCVTGLHGAAPFSSINSYMQELAPRMFPTMLYSLLGLEELARLRSGSLRRRRFCTLGVLAGLICWNSQDFGLTVTIAYFGLLVVGLPPALRRRSLTSWVGGLAAGLALYPLFGLLTGNPIQLADFGLFSRAYGGGFYQALIQVPGPVLVVLPLLLSSAGIGWCLLWRQRDVRMVDPPANDRTTLTLAFVGTWATAGFVYYLNRSYASAQLQILLMPCGVCLVALTTLVRDARAPADDGANRPAASPRTSLSLVPLAVLVSLGFASMLQTPNPVRVIKDLADAPATDRFTSFLISGNDIRKAESYVAVHGGSLGYFGNNGSYVHLETGLPIVILLDDPALLVSSPALKNKACHYLEAHSTKWILVSPTDDPEFGPVDLCGRYVPVSAKGVPTGILFARTSRTSSSTPAAAATTYHEHRQPRLGTESAMIGR